MASSENSRILRVVASVPRLSFPPSPKLLLLGFQRAKVSLLRHLKKILLDERHRTKLTGAEEAARVS